MFPPAILKSNDYKELNDSDRKNFEARLRYCEEVAEKAIAAVAEWGSESLREVDQIELDVYCILGSWGGTNSSPWLIHSSWTFECDRRRMKDFMSSEAASFLQTSLLSPDSPESEAVEWLGRWGHSLARTIKALGEARSFTEAITHLIAIDAIVASFLVFAARLRIGGAALN